VLPFLLSSCSLSDLFGKAGITQPATVTRKSPTTSGPEVSSADATAHLYPPMDLSSTDLTAYMTLDYKGIPLHTDVVRRDITDAVLEDEIGYLIIQSGSYTLDASRAVREGDWIEMAYKGYMDGQQFEGGTSDKATILLDEENSGYIPGFAAGLIGAEPGKPVELKLTFPDTYYTSLAGKEVTFVVEIHGVCTCVLTDELARTFSEGKHDTAEAFREFFRQYLTELEDSNVLSDVYGDIWTALSDRAVVTSWPEAQVEHYYHSIVDSVVAYSAQAGVTYEAYLDYLGYDDDYLHELARNQTKQDMILYYVANSEGIALDDAAYRDYLDQMVDYYNRQGYTYDADQIEEVYAAMYGEDYLRAQCFEEKICTAVYGYAVIIFGGDGQTEHTEQTEQTGRTD
jgi:FKBP-type peptidyl-prolyl cis-trans isomerase (trigger factor)